MNNNEITLPDGWTLVILNKTVTQSDITKLSDDNAYEIGIHTGDPSEVPNFSIQINVWPDNIEIININSIQKVSKLAIKAQQRIEITLA
ncbi:hypothetical protein [Weissella minor]|uniref:Uncharacterized protein n=1 Tax=Weissella minor TaxID=1620 RepID=A0A0R2JHS0_9LACO|nr:hypothetical protein [Weissella minor]KRN76888.1 hypothetical protein IV67_GL000397 [Weissella minor]